MKTKVFTGNVAILLIMIFIILSCNNKETSHKTGYVIGNDYRKCSCCGGVFVDYNKDTLQFKEYPGEINNWVEQYGFPLVIAFDDEDLDCYLNPKKMTYVELLSHP